MSTNSHSDFNAEMNSLHISAASQLHKLQHGLSRLPLELVWSSHDRWPLPNPLSGGQHRPMTRPERPMQIMVLDSSFNPPTMAHLALANSRRPSYQTPDSDTHTPGGDYDAKLLLLSVRNADKSLKAGDATYIQRLEMMALLAKDIKHYSSEGGSGGSPIAEVDANIAMAIIDEPTFVGKSSSLLEFLRQRYSSLMSGREHISQSPPETLPMTQLTFLVGFDTLERLFAPRYYGDSEAQMLTSLRQLLSPPPHGDDSRVVCARRVSLQSDSEEHTQSEQKTLELAQEFMASRITLINIGQKESTYSSSAVRSAIGQAGGDGRSDEWLNLVPTNVADYILKEGLYAQNL